MSQWLSKVRCRQRVLPMARAVHPKSKWSPKEVSPDQWLGKLIRLEKGSYQTSLTDLRMATKYAVSVEADYRSFAHHATSGSSPYTPSRADQFPASAETKGCKGDLLLLLLRSSLMLSSVCSWRHSTSLVSRCSLSPSLSLSIAASVSGKTLRCLGNASEVAVHTGPYFSGKIAVEGATHDSCSLYGNQSSGLQTYTMTINHLLCGSKVVVSRWLADASLSDRSCSLFASPTE